MSPEAKKGYPKPQTLIKSNPNALQLEDSLIDTIVAIVI